MPDDNVIPNEVTIDINELFNKKSDASDMYIDIVATALGIPIDAVTSTQRQYVKGKMFAMLYLDAEITSFILDGVKVNVIWKERRKEKTLGNA